MNNIWYIVLFVAIGYLILNKTNLIENFPYGYPHLNSHLKPWLVWNQPTRFPKLYYDIRGDPNIVYRSHIFGGLVPYGYIFGPYVYDAQGNLIYDSNKPHYIA